MKLELEKQIYCLKLLLKISKMKNLFLFIIFCTAIFVSNAQISVKADVDMSAFPEVEFIFHDRNPKVLNQQSFHFFEVIDGENQKIDSLSFKVIKDKKDYSKENKCVLIMVEYLNTRKEQTNTFLEALENSVVDFVKNGDKIKIVAFALKPFDNNSPLLVNITSGFSDDINQIQSDISYFKSQNRVFNFSDTPQSVSSIMAALSEGVDLLANQNNSFSKSIMLLSDERKNLYDQTEGVVVKAKEKNIAINTIKYNQSKYEQHTIPSLSLETYGESVVLSRSNGSSRNNNKKKNEAVIAISDILNNSVKRAAGVNYSVTFTLHNDIKDGENQSVTIKKINSSDITTFEIEKPGNWVVGQFQKNLVISIIVSLIFILIIIMLILFLRTKRNKYRIEKERVRINQLKAQKKNEAQILKQHQEIQQMKNLEENKKKQAQIEKKIKIDQDYELQLINKMKMLGSLPIINYNFNGKSFKFQINKPVVSVGRDKSTNDICIESNTISRNHFTIKFDESNNCFRVIDNNSVNGIIINGYKLKDAVLKHGDVIEITDVTFTFYI